MSKKIIAIAIALLMAFSVLSVIHPAKAATPGGVSVFLRPGVEDPFHPGWSQTLGTLRNHPDVVVNSYLNYAILASTADSASIGDLQFDITLDSQYTGIITLYIPEDFVFLKPDGTEATTSADRRFNVWTDITNDYSYVTVSKRNAWDSVAPFWTRIRIGYPGFQPDDDPAWYNGVTLDAGTYHIRVFNLKAPTVAGVYHFKMRLFPDWFDPNDFPIIIVKNELNPAFITGFVGLCLDLPCTQTDVSKYGKVSAEGTTPEGRSVSAAYYFAPGVGTGDVIDGVYTYWLFGVAPGTYTMYASAGGYPKSTGERAEVTAGQSMHLKTMWLVPGPTVDVTIYSKHGRGAIPWGSLWQPPYGTNDPTVVDLGRPRPVTLDLYDEDGNHVFWGGPWNGNTDPTSTSFSVTMLSDIGFTANVPKIGGENTDGFTSGVRYKVEAHITGYVMTEEDAWQREFTVSGGNIKLEMDLRRSNYFAITLHEIPLPSVPTNLVLAAEQDGVEKGVNSLLVAPNGDLWFWDSGYADYGPQVNPNTGLNYNINTDPIILEGWSHRYQYTQFEDDLAWRDYGLEPGTYEIKMYMADMGDQTGKWSSQGIKGYTGAVLGKGWYTIREGDAHTGSIALCNSPSLISFRVRLNSLLLKIRSVDWESPAHERPWLFPGAEVWADILDTDGNVVDSIANDLWGVVQDDGSIGSPYVGLPVPAPGEGTTLYVLFTGNDYSQVWSEGPDGGLPINNNGAYPTHIAPGQYKYNVHTYGYVERRNYPNVLTLGGMADIQVDLIQGGQIRVLMDFYKQHVLLPEFVDFMGFVRVEVFNENDELVGASIYGMAQPNPLARGSYLAYDTKYDFKKVRGEPAEGAGSEYSSLDTCNLADELTYGDCGFGQRAYTSRYFYGVPANTFADYYNLNPVDAQALIVPTDGVAAFDIFGFYRYWGDKSSRNDGLWANGFDTTSGTVQDDRGLRGSSDGVGIDGGGLYKVKVWAFEPGRWQSYYMVSDITGVEVPWGGAATVAVDLEQLGRLTGSIGWVDMYGNLNAMPWLQLTASSSEATVVAYSTPMGINPAESSLTPEPAYFMWLPGAAGTMYTVTAQATVAPQILAMPIAPPDISISPGFEASADLAMGPTGVPVPEFPVAPLVALSALAASLYVLKRRRK